jgi:serine protease AprX
MTIPLNLCPARRKAVWGPKRTAVAAALAILGLATSALAANPKHRVQGSSRHFRKAATHSPATPGGNVSGYKVDRELTRRKNQKPQERTKVIVTLVPGAELPGEFRRFARGDRKLDIINGVELELPNGVIKALEARPEVFRLHYDRPIGAHNYRTSVTVGATSARQNYGYSGAGVGVAIIDSGITSWHDDLTKGGLVNKIFPYGNQRVAKFVDFVSSHSMPYDDNGHGTHVAGVVGGNGYDSYGEKAGIAPGASLVVLKVLDANGNGSIGSVIAAMNWIATNAATYNIRVVNLSIGARITESYWTDPLTLAAKRLTDKGITVVTAAGNFGKAQDGKQQYGSITAPGNAPWVLTVGASSTQGTTTRGDDLLADYSSAGPTKFDYLAKPDLVAPGTGTVSLSAPGSLLFSLKATALLGSFLQPKSYLSLSGTSMAAPVVSGTIALMLQANPSLTPNLIKAILQYTAQPYAGYKPLQQGAGFLNALGAVRLARFYQANAAGSKMPVQASWGQHIIWGNHLISGGYLNPRGNAWANSTIWGAVKATMSDDNIVWGTLADDLDNIVWGTNDADGDNIVWGTMADDNIVWGTMAEDNIVWGTSIADDNIVWGTDCGGGDCDNIVWGTHDEDNIVWGTAAQDDNIVWGTNDEDNIVWGTNDEDNIVWGSSDGNTPDVVFPDSADGPAVNIEQELGQPAVNLFELVGGL